MHCQVSEFGLAARNTKLKLLTTDKLPSLRTKKYFFHCRIMYLTLLSRSLHYNINNNNICFICI